MGTVKHNLHQLLVVFDQFMNVLICMFVIPAEKSWADETFSARCHRWSVAGIKWPAKIVDTLFFWDKHRSAFTGEWIRHCEDSYLSEKYGRQLPPELRREE